MASEVLNSLATQYRLVSGQLKSAVEEEFKPWSVVKNSTTGKYGIFISVGLKPNWLQVRVDGNSNGDWKVTETNVCNNHDLWPEWIKKSKGIHGS